MKQKVLVTGGAGFIGSHLVDYLIEKEKFDVVVLDDLSGGFTQNINPKSFFVKGSVTDRNLIDSIFRKHRFSYVYHLAAYAAEGLSHFIKRFNYENNLLGSVNLINASVINNIKCFVFTSSIAVYGKNQLPMKESYAPRPEDSYGIAKYAVEQELAISHKMFGLNYVIFRPHNVYGERQNIADRYRNVIGIFMNNIMCKKDLAIFGDGEQERAFTYIKDIIAGIAESVQDKRNYNETFNIGSDTHVSVNYLASLVIKVMGRGGRIRHVKERNEIKYAYCDHSKFKEHFFLKSSTSLPDGLGKMAVWVKQTGARKSQPFENIEIYKNLPSVWKSV